MGLFSIFFIVIVCSQVRKRVDLKYINNTSPELTLSSDAWNGTAYEYRYSSTTKYIYKGQESEHHQFPWQAFLSSYYPNGSLIGSCGGSLIDPMWVLTAAHCFKSDGYYGPVGTVRVYLGAHNISLQEKSVQKFRSGNIIIHPRWRSKIVAGSHDIALVKLPRAAHINEFVKVVRLPDTFETFEKERATMSGWGYLNDNSSLSKTLQHTPGLVINNAECAGWYRAGIVSETNICVSGITGGAICSGDSGGPLVIKEEDGKPTLIGVTSFSSKKGCDTGKPSVFTRVSSFMNWIHESMGSKE